MSINIVESHDYLEKAKQSCKMYISLIYEDKYKKIDFNKCTNTMMCNVLMEKIKLKRCCSELLIC